MKEAKYVRCGRVIRNMAEGKDTAFDSITLAKRESRRLQMQEDGALGRGSVRVVETMKPLKEAS